MATRFTGWEENPTNNFYNLANQTGDTITVSYQDASFVPNSSSAQDTLALGAVNIDLTPGYAETIVQGSVRFTFGGRTYIDRSGQLYYDIDPLTGAGTFGGTLDYASGIATLTAWVGGATNAVTVESLMTTMNFMPVEEAVFKIAIAPVKTGSFSMRCVPADGGDQIAATSDASGAINTADMVGTLDHDSGVAHIRFGAWVVASGNEGEWWYDPANVVDGNIFKPRHVYADTIFYNAVGFSYLPLSSEILGLNPVRLPADGRVPVYQPGDVVVVLHDQITSGTYSSLSTLDLGRGRLAKLSVKDAARQPLDIAKYTADLDTGIITFGDLAGISQPLTITDRIEDMAVLSDVQITGTLTLSKALTHNFPVDETLVSNAIIYGTLYARTSIPFDQQTWTNEWSDVLIGSGVAAQYNHTQYPMLVNNASAIQERWVLIFASATTVNVIGENVGQILTGVSIGADIAPINPNTAEPYFTIPAQGWGAGWSAGNVLRFNTYGANAPAWIVQAIGQGEATDTDHTFCVEVRGDIDTP